MRRGWLNGKWAWVLVGIVFLYLYFKDSLGVFIGLEKPKEEPETGLKVKNRVWWAIIIDPWNIWIGR